MLVSDFGWLNDPILNFVLYLLIYMEAPPETISSWTTAVPGVATNWTSIEDVRRRRAPDTVKTGLDKGVEVNQYVRYSNQSTQYVCVVPMDSTQAPNYVEGEMFPACALFQNDWTAEQAEAHGYRIAYNTDYANRIQGTDASLFGWPVTTDKLAVYVSDIYRSAFLIQSATVNDWYDVELRRSVKFDYDILLLVTGHVCVQIRSPGEGPAERVHVAARVAVGNERPIRHGEHDVYGGPFLRVHAPFPRRVLQPRGGGRRAQPAGGGAPDEDRRGT